MMLQIKKLKLNSNDLHAVCYADGTQNYFKRSGH